MSSSSTSGATDVDFATVVRTRREMEQEKNRLDMKIAEDKTRAQHTQQQMLTYMRSHNLSQVVLPIPSEDPENPSSLLYVTCCQKLKREGLSADDMDRFFQTVCPTWTDLETIAKDMQTIEMEKSQKKTPARKKVKADPALPSPEEAYVEWTHRTIEELFTPVACPHALELRSIPCKDLGPAVELDESSPLFSLILTYQKHLQQIKQSTAKYKEKVEELKKRQEEAAERVRDYILRHRKLLTAATSPLPVVVDEKNSASNIGSSISSVQNATLPSPTAVNPTVVTPTAIIPVEDYTEEIDDYTDDEDEDDISPTYSVAHMTAPIVTPAVLDIPSRPLLTVTDVLSRQVPCPPRPQTVTEALNPLPPPIVYPTGMVEQRVTDPDAKNEASYIRVINASKPKSARVMTLPRTIAIKKNVAAIHQAWSDVSWQDRDRLTTLHHQTRQRVLQLFESELNARNTPPPPSFKLGIYKKPYENLEGKAKGSSKKVKK